MGNRLPHGFERGCHWLTCYVGQREGQRRVAFEFTSAEPQSHVELRVMLLNVLRAILLPEILDHGINSFGAGDWLCPKFRFNASRINTNHRFLQHIPLMAMQSQR